MPRYLMMTHEAGEWSEQAARLSPEEIQTIIARYQAWSERVAAQGKLLAGEKLKDGEGHRGQAARTRVG